MSYLDDAGLAHFWSKIKAALSIKQDELTGVPGQVVGFGEDGRAQAVLGQVSRNLLDNADFRRPMNRNGKEEYTGALNVTIDRWSHNGGTAIFSNGCARWDEDTVLFQKTSSDLSSERYYVSYMDVDGQVFGGPLIKRYSLYGDYWFTTDEADVFYMKPKADSPAMVAIKVELGTQQTLAHKEGDIWVLNDPPNYDLQYVLCSQYSQITGERVEGRYINKDLLDNSYFLDPINQVEKTEYTGTGYGIDRWYCSMVQVTAEGIRSMNRGSYIQQKLDGPVKDLLAGREITISCIVNGELYSGTGVYQASLSAQKYLFVGEDIQIVILTDGSILLWFPDGGKTIKSAKLELGRQQTLAHKEGDVWVLSELPNKMEELLKCQRYYIRARISRPLCFIFNDAGACSAWVSLKLPVAMRLNKPAVSRFTINSWISHQGKIYDTIGTDVKSVEVMSDGSCEKDGNIAFKFALNDDLAHYAAGSLGCIASLSLTLNANL